MEKKRILILGAGVSGLSAAWQLSKKAKKSSLYECTLLEKNVRPGGWMGSENREGFLVENGPRVFKTSRNAELLEIARDLSFFSSILPSSPSANSRYLWLDGKLQKMPSGLLSLFFSLLKELFVPPVYEDETIWDFACRRFGRIVAERFFDPLVLGIYAGDIKKLSIDSCFSLLKMWEREKGSVVRGALISLFKKSKKTLPFKSSLFSFKEGSGSFIQKWISHIPFSIHLGEEIHSLQRKNGLWEAHSHNKMWEGDEVVLALPAFVVAELLKKEAPCTSDVLRSIPYEDITTLQIGWKGKVLPFSAFGYLVPTIEKESILGVLFDSEMFEKNYTLITIMIRGVFHREEELQEIAKHVMLDHLKISQEPSLFFYKKMPKAIPQYVLGHQEKRDSLLSSLRQETQNLHLVGNYLAGVSVNDSIKQAKKVIDNSFF